MIDVTVENFEAEVLQASSQIPVLVDFWAPWCGPCKSLGPVLEKLEADYGGRFKLVKINSDDEQQISQAFGIRSIPTCVLLKDGKPADGFMGALPEGKVREFLDKHLPSATPECTVPIRTSTLSRCTRRLVFSGALAGLDSSSSIAKTLAKLQKLVPPSDSRAHIRLMLSGNSSILVLFTFPR